MVIYKILDTKNECYDAERIEKMELLYEGGYKIMKKADKFLTKLSIESQKSFKERIACAAYLPYMSQFVDHFSSTLFSDELTVAEAADADDPNTMGGTVSDANFYKEFATNCDDMNTSIHNFMKDKFTEALYGKCAFVGVDFENEIDSEPTSLLEEEEMGLSEAYLYCIDPLTVIDWEKDYAHNKFKWVKIKSNVIIHDNPLAAATHKVQFKIWTMNGEFAHWAIYESEELPLNKEPRATDEIRLVSEGDTSFTEIPVFELCIPKGLHIGYKLGPVCEEVFQRRSFLVSNMNKTCIAIPVIKLGPEIASPGDAMPSTVQQNPHRGSLLSTNLVNQGYTVLGQDDSMEMVEAVGSSHALVDKQINELVEKMHQLISQMSQSAAQNTKAMGRSGLSKQEDRHSTEILLTSYARTVKDFIREIYKCIAEARGEDVVWSVDGLSTFVEESRETIITEVTAVAGQTSVFALIPSETFKKKYLKRLAVALVGTSSPEEDATMQEEIEAGVKGKEHQDLVTGQAARDADAAVAANLTMLKQSGKPANNKKK